jgi:hypothetical protein
MITPSSYTLLDLRQPGALLEPQRAVIELQGSYELAVVDRDNKVNMHLSPLATERAINGTTRGIGLFHATATRPNPNVVLPSITIWLGEKSSMS